MRARLANAGTISAFLAAAVLLVPDAHAQGTSSPWHGFYVGGGGTFSNVSVEVDSGCYDDYCWWGDDYDYDEGDGAYGYSVHAGYRVNPWIGLEVGYVAPGSIRWKENFVYMPEFNGDFNNRVNFDISVTEISGLLILPFADTWEVYLRLGAGIWDSTSEQRLDDPYGDYTIKREFDDSGTGFLAGVGGGVTIADAWHVRFELQTLTIDEDALDAQDDTSLDSLLLEVQYRFGAHRSRAPAQPSAAPIATP